MWSITGNLPMLPSTRFFQERRPAWTLAHILGPCECGSSRAGHGDFDLIGWLSLGQAGRSHRRSVIRVRGDAFVGLVGAGNVRTMRFSLFPKRACRFGAPLCGAGCRGALGSRACARPSAAGVANHIACEGRACVGGVGGGSAVGNRSSCAPWRQSS